MGLLDRLREFEAQGQAAQLARELAARQQDPLYQNQLQESVLRNTLLGGQISQQGIMAPLQEQQAQADIQGQVLGNVQKGFSITQGQQEFPLRQRLLQAQIQNLQPKPEPILGPGQQDAVIYEQQTGGKIPAGYRPQRRFVQDPATGQQLQFIDVQPIEGTKPYAEGEAVLRQAEQGIGAVNDFLDQLAVTGTEKGGVKAAKLFEARNRILSIYAALNNLGVLQPGEYENLSKVLPDPTAFWTQLNPMAADNIAAVYEQLLGALETRYKDWQGQYWYVPAKPGTLPGQ